MKKITFLLLLAFAAVTTNAQLAKTKWKGTLQLDNPVDVIFDFGKDSLSVYTVAENSGLETMTYSAKDAVLSITKAYGQSDCDSQVTGKYKFEIKDDEMSLTLIADDCANRSAVLNNTKWKKAP
jgi:hypothetical protein